jgi:hypothetical protein
VLSAALTDFDNRLTTSATSFFGEYTRLCQPHIYNVNLPGCAIPCFVGPTQRAFYTGAVGKIFGFVQPEPLNRKAMATKRSEATSALAMEGLLHAWSQASLRRS